MLSNINNVCRLCMTHESVLLPIFWNVEGKFNNTASGQLDLRTKITSFAAIEISENDGLPSQICQQCVIEVNRTYNFKKQCENTDATLRQCFMSLHSNTEAYQKMDVKDVRMNENHTINANDSTFTKQNIENECGSEKLTENTSLIKPEVTDTHYNHGIPLLLVDCEDRSSARMEVEPCGVDQGNVPVQISNDDVAMSSDDENMTMLEPIETEKFNNPLTEVIIVNGKRFHQCLVCGKSFGHKPHLTDHVRIHTQEEAYPYTSCNKSYTQKSFAYPRSLHNGEKPHACSYCDKTFSHKSHLINHMRLHTGEKPYSCSVCGKTFSLHSSLRSHLNHHTGFKPYICTFCSKSYSKRSSLMYHLGFHKPQKLHECIYCNKKFTRKSHLKVHIRIHNGERPYICSECGKCFSFNSSLASHMLHHTGEIHSCHICNKVYSNRSSLSYHLGLHKEEKPHQCSYCGKVFSHKSYLTNHIRLHTGEKPFLCNMCGQAFAVKSTLSLHLKRFHGLKAMKMGVRQDKE